jgi:hypothetical protein
VYDRIAPREGASSWYRIQMRQALWFGNATAAASIVALAWPLLASFVVADVGVVIRLYMAALVIDTALFLYWLVHAVRYSRRAANGDLFEIEWIARITGTRPPKP